MALPQPPTSRAPPVDMDSTLGDERCRHWQSTGSLCAEKGETEPALSTRCGCSWLCRKLGCSSRSGCSHTSGCAAKAACLTPEMENLRRSESGRSP